MTEPMTAAEARNVSNGIAALCETDAGLDTPKGRIDLREVVKSLNEHADMLDRKSLDRLREKIENEVRANLSWRVIDLQNPQVMERHAALAKESTDRILAFCFKSQVRP